MKSHALRFSLGAALVLLATSASAQAAGKGKGSPTTPPAPAAPTAPRDAKPAPPVNSEENPWSKGISDENKAKARALLAEGNDEFVQDRHKEALEKYQLALAVWDHPAIAFNAVRALVRLDRPIEASDMLQRAMRYQAAPLGAEVFAEAQNYQRLLAGLVANVEVSCSEPATLSVDGEAVTCPGKRAFRLKPGRHTVAASQPGFVALSRVETLLAGDNPEIAVKLLSVEKATETRTRWATWKPWVVTGSGLALAAVGIGIEFQALSYRSEYAAAVRDQCSKACLPNELNDFAKDKDSKWRNFHIAGVSTIAVGGAVLATGVTLLVLNRPRARLREQPRVAIGFDVVSHGIMASGSF
ncbi:MAG TPA: tetratricopeptide repeat protein [Kofleriaceae bacterium]|nr:tetratricopeptide repeat protein [Kofleriaceae bacterium]